MQCVFLPLSKLIYSKSVTHLKACPLQRLYKEFLLKFISFFNWLSVFDPSWEKVQLALFQGETTLAIFPLSIVYSLRFCIFSFLFNSKSLSVSSVRSVRHFSFPVCIPLEIMSMQVNRFALFIGFSKYRVCVG